MTVIEPDTTLKRVAGTNGGEWAGGHVTCGKGDDRLRVWPYHPDGRGRFWCRQCEKSGDAIDYVRNRDGCDYAGACKVIESVTGVTIPLGSNGGNGTRPHTRPVHREKPKPMLSPAMEADGPTYDLGEALLLVEMCERVLWSDTGSRAREYLVSRGIREDTARAWGLGFNPEERNIGSLKVARGIVIPGWVGHIPWYVKIRKATGKPKYIQVEGSKPALYGLDMLQGRSTVVICEGELDAILLHQEAGDLVDVVAIGSKSASPAVPCLGRLIGASRWLLALDLDADPEAAKWGEWSERVKRAKPLQGNDLTDFWREDGDLRRWVTWHLERATVERLNIA